MYCLLLLLLVGTISAQEPGDFPQDESNEMADANEENSDCEMPDNLETTSVEDFHLEQCDNATVKVKGFDRFCPDKSNCYYQAFNCPTTYARAQYSCRCRRGSLSIVQNLWVNARIRCVARTACSNRHYVWIGAWKPANSCVYVNSQGTRISYSNFAWGQYRTHGAWCVAMNLSNGLWYTLNCHTCLPYICTI